MLVMCVYRMSLFSLSDGRRTWGNQVFENVQYQQWQLFLVKHEKNQQWPKLQLHQIYLTEPIGRLSVMLTARGCGPFWKSANDFLELLLKATLCYKMTQGWPSLGVQTSVQWSARTCEGAPLHTRYRPPRLNPRRCLTLGHTLGAGAAWYGIPAADLSSHYLFVLLYLQTIHCGDLPGKESAAKAWMMALGVRDSGCFLILSCLNGGRGTGGRMINGGGAAAAAAAPSQPVQTAVDTTNCLEVTLKCF